MSVAAGRRVLNRGGKGVKSPVDDLKRRRSGVCYTETIYNSMATAARIAMHYDNGSYGDLMRWVLCRDFAAQRCYKETIA